MVVAHTVPVVAGTGSQVGVAVGIADRIVLALAVVDSSGTVLVAVGVVVVDQADLVT